MRLQYLRDLVEPLQAYLGCYWTITVYDKEEAEMTGTFDPACAYLEAESVFGSIQITVDGEIHVEPHGADLLYVMVERGRDWKTRIGGELRRLLMARVLAESNPPRSEPILCNRCGIEMPREGARCSWCETGTVNG